VAKLRISSDHSAQPSTAKPNPFLGKAIEFILSGHLLTTSLSRVVVADQGCGKLRHIGILQKYFRRIIVIDTKEQFARRQTLFDTTSTTVPSYVEGLGRKGATLRAVFAEEFSNSSLGLSVVFNVCVMDVVLPAARKMMAQAAHKNLADDGLFVMIVPRNDQSILVRCGDHNAFEGGHVFNRQGIVTFYSNFKDTGPLIRLTKKAGFTFVADLSVYRQVCLIFRKRSLARRRL
jgi:hypothetical protein